MSINIQALIESAERTARIYNNILPPAELKRMAQMATEAARAAEPVLRMMRDPHFRRQMEEIRRMAERIRPMLEQSHALTLPAIRAMNELYGVVDETAEAIAPTYDIPEEKREAVVTRPLFSATKTQIRKGIPSVKEILPLALPLETKWEDVQMRFVDPHNLFIEIPRYKDAKITASYHDMGMWDGRSKQPNAQWTVLRGLAQYSGMIDWETPIASPKIKKQKQLLAEALKQYFNIDGDPFMVYQKEKAYRLKLTLIPDADAVKREQSETESYFDEIAPSIYDPYENE